MGDKTLKRVLRVMQEEEYVGRSDVYRWLRNRHGQIAAARDKHDPSWAPVAREIAAAGVLGRDGKLPTRKTIAKIWHRVCRDVAAEISDRTTTLLASGANRSRAPATWRPTAIPPPVLAMSSQSQPNSVASTPKQTEAEARADAQLARLRRHVDERSGRKSTS